MSDPKHTYALRRACKNCPFRTDIAPFLTTARAEQLRDHLRRGDVFWCHKTVTYLDDGTDTEQSRRCAGAAKVLENEGSPPGQGEQIAQRLGLADPHLDDDQPVFDNLDDWVDAQQL